MQDRGRREQHLGERREIEPRRATHRCRIWFALRQAEHLHRTIAGCRHDAEGSGGYLSGCGLGNGTPPAARSPENRPQLLDWALGRSTGSTDWRLGNRDDHGVLEVIFQTPGVGRIVEAVITKARNGLAINFPDPTMRRRDPDAMVIGDVLPTDKPTYAERFGTPFDKTRQQTLDWLKTQELVAMPFYAGTDALGYGSLLIVPRQAAFFAAALADLQGMIPRSQVPADFRISGGVLFVAPPFRHTHFGGKQVVVHDRTATHQEVFAYNLYPGPSAKKGVYSMLLDICEREGWTTNHCAAVAVVTPYENQLIIMHEGASGGGKSEMTEHIHRMEDGRLLIGRNVITKEERTLNLPEACHLRPIADDMACAHPSFQRPHGRLTVADAENAWFVRVDHIHSYGTAPDLERLCIDPPEPLIFLNHYIVPGGTCLTWEHVEDAPGKVCPNPRVILPRRMIEDIAGGPQAVDVRSFGVRCPPTHRDSQLYGILALMHVLSPALAWLWRLVAPRGHANPSIQTQKGAGDAKRGRGIVLGVCHGPARGPGQPAAAPDCRHAGDALCADAEPAHWRVEGGVHGGVDRARVPGAARQREVCPRTGGGGDLPAAGLHSATSCGLKAR